MSIPAMNKLDGIFVYDIDDLQQAVTTHVADRQKEADRAEAIVSGEVERFQQRLQTLDVVPTIVSLQEHLETIRQAEIDRVRGTAGPLSPEQELAVEALTRGIVNKIMHTPITTLKTAAREAGGDHGGRHRAAAVRSSDKQGLRTRKKTRNGEDREEIPEREVMALLRIGSRGSQLALWQATHIKALLERVDIKLRSKSSRRLATTSPMSLLPRSAPRACSPRKLRKPCSKSR